MVGVSLAHFRITAKLGQGGMGEVWQADDGKLGRAVAIKLLPSAVSDDAERLMRFEREARMLAALNHSRIAAVYSFERAEIDGRPIHFLVMELAPGETLEARIARGGLSADEALPIALQIAEGLEAAHERGIIHRDLKPANVKVGASGEVKVLDFGLAKALDDPGGGDSGIGLSVNSPTMSARMTQAGMLMGTAAYMSPEQARGHAADKRADVWAFGLVLLEMLTGKCAFAAQTVSDTLAGVLRADPDWDDLPAETPRAVRTLLERCLDKNAKNRLRDIGEARIAIERYLADPTAGPEPAVAAHAVAPAPRMRWLPWALAAAAVAVATWAMLQPGPTPEVPELVRFSVRPTEGTAIADQYPGLALSPDGRRVIFTADNEAGVRRLWSRDVDAVAALPIPGTEDGSSPFFSPDGQSIGYFTFSELKRVSLGGGAPIVLAPVQNPRGGTWAGTTIVLPLATDGGLFAIPAAGGEPRPVTTVDASRNERTHRWPSALPDGRTVLFTSDTFESTEYYDDARIEAVSIDDGRRTTVIEGASMARFVPPGHLVFARGGSLYGIAFDPRKLVTHGEPVLVQQGVFTAVSSGAAHFAVSSDGNLVHMDGDVSTAALSLAWVAPGQPDEFLEIGQRNQVQQVNLSPDERFAAITTSVGQSADVWIVDLGRLTQTRLTFQGNNWDPVWSPDGTRIAFASSQDGVQYRPYWKAADGSDEDTLLWESGAPTFPSSFSPDGKLLAVEVRAPGTASDIWIVPLDGAGEPYPFLATPRIEWHPRFSPDGRWLAYASNETGRNEIYVRPFPGPGGRWQVSIDGGNEPHWSPDGSRLYFRAPLGIAEVDVETRGTFRAGMPRMRTKDASTSPFNHLFAATADGSRILTAKRFGNEIDDHDIVVTLNWFHELWRRLAPR